MLLSGDNELYKHRMQNVCWASPCETGSGGYQGSQTELESTLSHDYKKQIL